MIEFKKLYLQSKCPTKATTGSVGYDIYSSIDETIDSLSTSMISTGIAINIPSKCYGQIASRSSLAKSGIFVQGGVVDQDYTGEIKVILFNSTKERFHIKEGDKIAQIIFIKVSNHFVMKEVDSLTKKENNQREEKGFGSSGK